MRRRGEKGLELIFLQVSFDADVGIITGVKA